VQQKTHDTWLHHIVTLLTGHFFFISSPCQRQSELLPSLGIRRPLTFHILIFSSFGSFDKAASEEKIFLEINQSETGIACGSHVC
jgi:hypothetical protein